MDITNKFPIFPLNKNGKNFSFKFWKMRFEMLATSQNLTEAFDIKCENLEKRIKLKTMIIMSLDDQTLSLLASIDGLLDCDNSGLIWTNLVKNLSS